MICQEKDSLRYYQFESFLREGVTHACFARLGGVSPAPFASLNTATTGGDSKAHVLENLRRMYAVLGLDLASRYDGWQIHCRSVICTDVPRSIENFPLPADGLATDKKGVTLTMRFGDCVPVLLFDRKKRVCAMYHAGWRGCVDQMGAVMVEKMQRVYGTQATDIIAGIGPSIGLCHFEVQQDVATQFAVAYPTQWQNLHSTTKSGTHIDLWCANEFTLKRVGVQAIETAAICTVCHKDEWFSHRGDSGKTGRFGAVITLDSGT